MVFSGISCAEVVGDVVGGLSHGFGFRVSGGAQEKRPYRGLQLLGLDNNLWSPSCQ